MHAPIAPMQVQHNIAIVGHYCAGRVEPDKLLGQLAKTITVRLCACAFSATWRVSRLVVIPNYTRGTTRTNATFPSTAGRIRSDARAPDVRAEGCHRVIPHAPEHRPASRSTIRRNICLQGQQGMLLSCAQVHTAARARV
eukprot:366028-Chlamydomonas_euryale.AAC.39